MKNHVLIVIIVEMFVQTIKKIKNIGHYNGNKVGRLLIHEVCQVQEVLL